MTSWLPSIGMCCLALFCVSGCSQLDSPTQEIASEPSSEDRTPGDDFTVYDMNGNVISVVSDPNRPVTAPLAKQVLEDGVVTDEENAQVNQLYKECLEAGGITEVEFGPGGRVKSRNPDGMTVEQNTRLKSRCGGPDETGWNAVSSFYWESITNPNHIDYSILMAECLARVGLVPEGYTPEQYVSDMRNDTLPFTDGTANEKFSQCNDDPLHAQ